MNNFSALTQYVTSVSQSVNAIMKSNAELSNKIRLLEQNATAPVAQAPAQAQDIKTIVDETLSTVVKSIDSNIATALSRVLDPTVTRAVDAAKSDLIKTLTKLVNDSVQKAVQDSVQKAVQDAVQNTVTVNAVESAVDTTTLIQLQIAIDAIKIDVDSLKHPKSDSEELDLSAEMFHNSENGMPKMTTSY